LRRITERAIDQGAKMIWVTEKDAVKLEPSVSSLPIYKVVMQVDILDDQELFERIIEGNSTDRLAHSISGSPPAR
jgi:tetraacyldisaccharide-1-P 4'-kinase